MYHSYSYLQKLLTFYAILTVSIISHSASTTHYRTPSTTLSITNLQVGFKLSPQDARLISEILKNADQWQAKNTQSSLLTPSTPQPAPKQPDPLPKLTTHAKTPLTFALERSWRTVLRHFLRQSVTKAITNHARETTCDLARDTKIAGIIVDYAAHCDVPLSTSSANLRATTHVPPAVNSSPNLPQLSVSEVDRVADTLQNLLEEHRGITRQINASKTNVKTQKPTIDETAKIVAQANHLIKQGA